MPTRHNSRIYPIFLPQLEKIHETSPSARDEAQFPCIACSAIPCSQYNTKGTSICLMEFQRVPTNNLASLEWHWCHQRNVKLFGVILINSRWRPNILYWIECNPPFPILQDRWLVLLSATTNIPWYTRLKSRGTPISAQELKESSMEAISSWKESGFQGFYWRSRPNFHKHLKSTLPSAIGMWEGPWVCCLNRVDTEMPWL